MHYNPAEPAPAPSTRPHQPIHELVNPKDHEVKVLEEGEPRGLVASLHWVKREVYAYPSAGQRTILLLEPGVSTRGKSVLVKLKHNAFMSIKRAQ